MKNRVWHSFRLEIILYALTSMALSLLTVGVLTLVAWIIYQGSEGNDWNRISIGSTQESNRYMMNSAPQTNNASPSTNQFASSADSQTPSANHFASSDEEKDGAEENFFNQGNFLSQERLNQENYPGIRFEEPKRGYHGWWFGGIVLTLFLFIVYFLLLTEKFSRYLNEIADGIQEISAGNFDIEFTVRHEDELSMIAEGLNKMTGDVKLMMENERNIEYSKNELITNVAHDLRTPLTSIIGYLGLVADNEKLDEETRHKYIVVAYEKAKRLERLIDDLFSYTKVSFGQITLRKSTVDMVKLTEQLLDEFYPSIQSAQLETEFLTNEKQVLLEVDGDLMARAIANLISNAIKYGKDGKALRVELQRVKEVPSTRLLVTNYGRIIPEEDLEHLFDKFYRVESSRSTDTGGTGLGLAITRNIVRMHNGTISVKSDPNGTVFTITLYDRAEDNPEAQEDEENEA